MYGSDVYGSVPYGASGFGLDDIFDVEAMLSESRADLVYTVELTVWNIAEQQEETLYLGSAEWATYPGDVPSSAPFDGRLTTALDSSRSLVGERIGINYQSGEGRIAWGNADGAYDTYVEDYAIDGRQVVIRLGRKTDALKDHLVIFRGVAIDWEADEDSVSLTVRDRGAELDVPAQPNVYDGVGSTPDLGVGSELVTNGTFDSDLSDWTVDWTGSWVWDAGSGNGMAATAEGAELVTNGTFNSDTSGWSASGFAWSSGGGNGFAAVSAFTCTLSQALTTVAEATYRITVTFRDRNPLATGTLSVSWGGATIQSYALGSLPASATFTVTAVGTSTTLLFSASIPGIFPGTAPGVDDISVKRADPGTLSQTIPTADGSTYQIQVTRRGVSGGCVVKFGGQALGIASAGQSTFYGEAVDTSSVLELVPSSSIAAGGGQGVDEVSVKIVLEGPGAGPDIQGKRRPMTFGEVFGVPPVLVKPTLLIYQVHDHDPADGFIAETIAVYDRGVALTMLSPVATYTDLEGASMSPGEAMSSLDGYFRIGGALAGTVFATVRSYIGGSEQPITTDVMSAILARHGSPVDIDAASFDAVSANPVPSYIGVHVGASDAVTVAGLFDSLMAGIGGWAGFNRKGALSVGTFTAPTAPSVASFDRAEGDIIDLSIEPMPGGIWPPPWRWRVAYLRNYTVFNDFAASVATEEQLFYAEPYRLVEASDDGILADHPTALDVPPVEAYYADLGRANDEALRLLALHASGYRLYKMTLARYGLSLELGDVIRVRWPRYGLDAGKLLRIASIGDRIDISNGSGVEQIEIKAFG